MNSMVRDGFLRLGNILPAQACADLAGKIRAHRSFGPQLFLSEREFRANPTMVGVNPRKGRNLLEPLEPDLAFIDQNPAMKSALTDLLGAEYQLMQRKVVCGVPHDWLPEWLLKETRDYGIANLGSYIRPEYRDITYFHGIDFHQDIIDWRGRKPDFITLYVYIEEVTEKDAPLFILPQSHRLGATTFPHQLRSAANDSRLEYTSPEGRSIKTTPEMLLGSAGSVSLWHPFFLHGTRPDTNSRERISLRYLIGRSSTAAHCFLDEVNKGIEGAMTLQVTQEDADATGKVVRLGNIINAIPSR